MNFSARSEASNLSPCFALARVMKLSKCVCMVGYPFSSLELLLLRKGFGHEGFDRSLRLFARVVCRVRTKRLDRGEHPARNIGDEHEAGARTGPHDRKGRIR